jgi:beta-glucosidase-like glycosyl hydrolase
VTASLARLVFPSLRAWPSRGGFAHERAKIDAALRAGVGGFIIFGGDRESVGALTRDLRGAANHPLLIGADLERGPAQQVSGHTELPPPAALGALGDLEATHTAGIITGQEARAVGVNWAFAPVCDLDVEPRNPIVQTRSFGADPATVGEHVAAWIRGCQEHGVLACAKHYPGHGRTTEDSHVTLPEVTTPAAELQRSDLIPFAAAVRAGVGSVMSAFVAYSGWDASGRAASFSALILDYLRTPLGFTGLVVTDALIMAGATARQAEAPATATAVAAGCDAILYPDDFAAVVRALDRAVGSGTRGVIAPARAEEALARCERTAAAWNRGADQGDPDLRANATFADQLADRVVHFTRGDPPTLRTPLTLVVVDDDLGGPFTVGPRDVLERELRENGIPVASANGNTTVVLVYAEPRSWKGRADLGARSLAALRALTPSATLVVLFAHPRLTFQVPGKAPILCAWHGEPLLQRAVARWVRERIA